MNVSMRKIVYYENILEFKQTTGSKLNLNELNNWQLCRTCLADTNEEDMDLEKMCVMDVVEGRLLSIKEILVKVTPLQLHKDDKLRSLRMCKECLGKSTIMYFFSIQVKKAEEVLRKLSENLIGTDDENSSDVLLENTRDLKSKNQINVEMFCTDLSASTTKFGEHEMSLESNDQIYSMKCSTDGEYVNNKEVVDEIQPAEEDKLCELPCSNENPIVANETIIADIEEISKEDEIVAGSACSNENQNDAIIVDSKERLENVDHNCISEDCLGQADSDFDVADEMVDEVYLIDEQDEMLDDTINDDEMMTDNEETEEEYVLLRATTEFKKTSQANYKTYKHKQLRVTKPLLENMKCGVCEKIFGRQRELVSHVKLEHPHSKAYQCRDCGALFSHTQSLSRHMNTHKPMLNKNVCEYCSKDFMRPDDLRRHIRVHTGERPYSCPLCEKAFKQQGEMKQHVAIHLQQKQYECGQCDRAFASRNSLYLHKKSHSIASDDDLKCSECGINFNSKQDVLSHKQRVHEKEIIT